MGFPKSARDWLNTKRMALAIPGVARGKVILLKTLPLEAPRSRAASSRAGSIAWSTPYKVK